LSYFYLVFGNDAFYAHLQLIATDISQWIDIGGRFFFENMKKKSKNVCILKNNDYTRTDYFIMNINDNKDERNTK